jgi:hypothetical protein
MDGVRNFHDNSSVEVAQDVGDVRQVGDMWSRFQKDTEIFSRP